MLCDRVAVDKWAYINCSRSAAAVYTVLCFTHLTNTPHPCHATHPPQAAISTRYQQRLEEPNVRNYGRLVSDLAGVVPDGLVVFFVSYSYMDYVISRWHDMGVLEDIMAHKLVFIETQVRRRLTPGCELWVGHG